MNEIIEKHKKFLSFTKDGDIYKYKVKDKYIDVKPQVLFNLKVDLYLNNLIDTFYEE